MISQRDIERWFESSHFRRKCDWVCIDQPKVIKAWANRHLIGQFIIAADIEPPNGWVKNQCSKYPETGYLTCLKSRATLA